MSKIWDGFPTSRSDNYFEKKLKRELCEGSEKEFHINILFRRQITFLRSFWGAFEKIFYMREIWEALLSYLWEGSRMLFFSYIWEGYEMWEGSEKVFHPELLSTQSLISQWLSNQLISHWLNSEWLSSQWFSSQWLSFVFSTSPQQSVAKQGTLMHFVWFHSRYEQTKKLFGFFKT